MTPKDALKIIAEGESNTTEFKRKFSSYEKIAKELIAFANTSGGNIFLGVDDDKSIVGVESEKESTVLLTEAAEKYCEPKVEIKTEVIMINGKDVVIGTIKESNNKPHRIQDYKKIINYKTASVYLRVKSKSIQASPEMIKFLHTSYGNFKEISFTMGEKEKSLFQYLEKNEKITTKEYCKLVNISERRAQRILIKLTRLNVINMFQEDSGAIYFSGK